MDAVEPGAFTESGFRVFEHVNPDGNPDWLITCDHASNAIPPEIGDLGIPAADLARHIAYDPGALGVARALVRALDAPGVFAGFSRLVIDPNRGESDPTLVMRISDGTVIEGNRSVDSAEIAHRLETYARPYRRAIDRALDQAQAAGAQPKLVSIHSFTTAFRHRRRRPWQVGVLWAGDSRLARPLLRALAADPELVVGDNEPYRGGKEGDCLWSHAIARGIPGCLVELRNDLIDTAERQEAWGARLAMELRGIAPGPAPNG